MITLFKFFVFIICFFCLAIASHWAGKKVRPNGTKWIVAIRACMAGLLLTAGFIVVNVKTSDDKQVVARSYEDPFKKEHELAQQLAQAEAIKIAKRQAIPDVKIQTIMSDYEKNEINADNLYKGKTVRIAGTVIEIQKNVWEQAYILIGEKIDFITPPVQAFFDGSYNAQLAQLTKGDHLTIVCEISGLLVYIRATNCEIE